jgi:hypothetical protein
MPRKANTNLMDAIVGHFSTAPVADIDRDASVINAIVRYRKAAPATATATTRKKSGPAPASAPPAAVAADAPAAVDKPKRKRIRNRSKAARAAAAGQPTGTDTTSGPVTEGAPSGDGAHGDPATLAGGVPSHNPLPDVGGEPMGELG